MAEIDLVELVRNGTMSAEMGATLWATAEQRRSFVIVAIPRLAGKTTVMRAMLERVPAGTPVRTLIDHPQDVDALASQPAGGYLVVPEVSKGPVPGYIWGEPARRVFELLADCYALATSMHAPGIEQALHALTHDNAVPDAHVAQLQLGVYIRSLGDDWEHPTRRVVAEVREIDGLSGGQPDTRLLHRWDEASDRFEQVAASGRPDHGDLSHADRILDDHAESLRRAAEERPAAG